jgi:hypothetical protein
MIEVEYPGQDLEGKAGRETVHAFVNAGVVSVFLIGLGLGIRVLQAFAVIDAHLGIQARVLGLFQP